MESFSANCVGPDDERDAAKLDALSVACVMEGFDDDDEEGIIAAAEDFEVLPAPKFNKDIEAVNETIRIEATNIHAERPQWLPSWVKLIAIIRCAIYPVFWEMFAESSWLKAHPFLKSIQKAPSEWIPVRLHGDGAKGSLYDDCNARTHTC